MPDEMVEKVARAIYEARGAHEPPRAWRKWEDIGGEAQAVWGRCAEAALSAAHAEPVDVRAGAINSAAPVAVRPSPFLEDLDMVAVAAEAETKPVARDPSRFSRLSQDEPPVIRERPDPTLGFISTAEMLASPSEAAIRADERDLLAEMGKHTNWELSYSGGWTDDPAVWTVHEVTGGRNDRVWTEIGSGATPAEAIATAIRARGEAITNAKGPGPA